MSALDQEITAASAWLRQQAQTIGYGELAVKLIFHAGAVSRTEKTVTSKTQPQGGNGHERAGS